MSNLARKPAKSNDVHIKRAAWSGEKERVCVFCVSLAIFKIKVKQSDSHF